MATTDSGDDEFMSRRAILADEAYDPPGRLARFGTHMRDQVDEKQCILPLAACCFMTGYFDCISISAFSVWCGFQTGNFTNLAISFATLLSQHTPGFYGPHTAERALFSLLFFDLGAFWGRLGDSPRFSCKSRSWLFSCTILQGLLCATAALTTLQGYKFSPLYAVACLSASMGLQGVNAKRLNSQLSTTVVLTALWCDLMTDPKLFAVPFRRGAILRDQKLFALVCLFSGAVIAQLLLESNGTTSALGLGVGLRLLIALGWLFVPAKKGISLS